MRTPEIGGHVVWTDSQGVDHNALIQCVWSNTCINLVFVSGDENRKDSYGRQLEHATSCTHATSNGVHGFYWRWPEEAKNGYTPPQAV